jgi:hypothetical protein
VENRKKIYNNFTCRNVYQKAERKREKERFVRRLSYGSEPTDVFSFIPLCSEVDIYYSDGHKIDFLQPNEGDPK